MVLSLVSISCAVLHDMNESVEVEPVVLEAVWCTVHNRLPFLLIVPVNDQKSYEYDRIKELVTKNENPFVLIRWCSGAGTFSLALLRNWGRGRYLVGGRVGCATQFP